MKLILLILVFITFILCSKNRNPNTLSTSFGAPVGNNKNSISAGRRGPLLLGEDIHLREKLTHFNRERIPERVVHAKGAGAYGYFEVTNEKIRK